MEYSPRLKVTKVIWKFPAAGWIKYNTDGASRGNPGISAYAFTGCCVCEQKSDHPSKVVGYISKTACWHQERQETPCISNTRWREHQVLQDWRGGIKKVKENYSPSGSKEGVYMSSFMVKQISFSRWYAEGQGGASQLSQAAETKPRGEEQEEANSKHRH